MFISLTGLFLDWIITRDWKGVCCLLVPFGLLAVLLIGSLIGSRIPADLLARQYVAAGQKELDEIPDWAFNVGPADGLASEAGTARSTTQVSRFTEALFYRAQRLKPGDPQIVWVIGGVLAQRGAKARAKSIMQALAPDKTAGFLPAHAWLAYELLGKPNKDASEMELMRHHLDLGITWEQAPAQLLTAATRLALFENKRETALDLMIQSAGKSVQYEGELFRLALRLGNERVAERTAGRAQPRLEEKIEKGEETPQDLIDLADIYFYQRNSEKSRQILDLGLKSDKFNKEQKKLLSYALSEVYRLRFNQTLKVSGDSWSADVRLLDQAMRRDPTNPNVSETVAMLARIGGDKPPELLMKQLNQFLAEGTATPVTHAWIAEAHILRKEYDEAIGHLESVLERMPNSPQSLNNLAYAIALHQGDKRDQLEMALGYVNKAIEYQGVAVENRANVADFYDTRGFILAKLGRDSEAITSLEMALERQKNRPDFHENLAILYERNDKPDIAKAHRAQAAKMRELAASQKGG